MVRREMTFDKQRLEGGERISHVDVWGETLHAGEKPVQRPKVGICPGGRPRVKQGFSRFIQTPFYTLPWHWEMISSYFIVNRCFSVNSHWFLTLLLGISLHCKNTFLHSFFTLRTDSHTFLTSCVQLERKQSGQQRAPGVGG